MPGRSNLVRNAKTLHQRLFIYEDPSSSSVDEPSSDPAPAGKIDIAAQLQEFLNQQYTNSPAESIYTFSKEVQLFAVGREQTTSIAAVEIALLTIPLNFEAERVFFAARLFFTGLRISLSDRLIDRLMFLRFEF